MRQRPEEGKQLLALAEEDLAEEQLGQKRRTGDIEAGDRTNTLDVTLVALDVDVGTDASPSLYAMYTIPTQKVRHALITIACVAQHVIQAVYIADIPGSRRSALYEKRSFVLCPTSRLLAHLRKSPIEVHVCDDSAPTEGGRDGSVPGLLGTAYISAALLADGANIDDAFDVVTPSGRSIGKVEMRMQWAKPLLPIDGTPPTSLSLEQFHAYTQAVDSTGDGVPVDIVSALLVADDKVASSVAKIRQAIAACMGRRGDIATASAAFDGRLSSSFPSGVSPNALQQLLSDEGARLTSKDIHRAFRCLHTLQSRPSRARRSRGGSGHVSSDSEQDDASAQLPATVLSTALRPLPPAAVMAESKLRLVCRELVQQGQDPVRHLRRAARRRKDQSGDSDDGRNLLRISPRGFRQAMEDLGVTVSDASSANVFGRAAPRQQADWDADPERPVLADGTVLPADLRAGLAEDREDREVLRESRDVLATAAVLAEREAAGAEFDARVSRSQQFARRRRDASGSSEEADKFDGVDHPFPRRGHTQRSSSRRLDRENSPTDTPVGSARRRRDGIHNERQAGATIRMFMRKRLANRDRSRGVPASSPVASVRSVRSASSTWDDVAAMPLPAAEAALYEALAALDTSGSSPVQLLRDTFAAVADKRGTITARGFRKAFKKMGASVPRDAIKAFIESWDTDGSGDINYEEFLEFVDVTMRELQRDDAASIRSGRSSSARGGDDSNGLRRAMSKLYKLVREEDPATVFQVFDKDGDGRVSRKEFKRAAKKLKLSRNPAVLNALVDAFDYEGDGEVDLPTFEEFLDSLSSFSKAAGSNTASRRLYTELGTDDANLLDSARALLQMASVEQGISTTEFFAQIDKDASGSVSASELRRAMRKLGVELSEYEQNLVYRAMDSDGRGGISERELAEFLGTSDAGKSRGSKRKSGVSKLSSHEWSKLQHKLSSFISTLQSGSAAQPGGEPLGVAALRRVFRNYDPRKRNKVTVTSFSAVLRKKGLLLTRTEEAALIWKFKVGATGSGSMQVDYDAMLKWVSATLMTSFNAIAAKISNIFRVGTMLGWNALNVCDHMTVSRLLSWSIVPCTVVWWKSCA